MTVDGLSDHERQHMGMASTIDLTADQRRTVLGLLNRHLPNTTVWAYGSRVKWTSHPASDLDLVAFAKPEQSPRLAELREAFDDSFLPFRVDLFVWDDVPKDFRKRIEADHMVLADGRAAAPTDWPMVALGDCASLVNDKVDPAKCGDLPYIGLEHIGQGTLSLLGIGTAGDVESTKTAFRAGDILFGKLRPYFRKVVRPNFDGICSTDIWVVRPKAGVDAGYLFYLMASKVFVDFASRGSEGTRMPRAKWEHVARYAVRLPSVSDQRAIAHVLGTLDDKIELNLRMAETLEQLTGALFKSWFGKSDLGGTGLPDGWSIRSLDEVARFQNGLALQKYPPLDGEECLPILKIAELRSGTADDGESASADIPSGCIVDSGDLIFSWSGSLMASVWCGGRAALNQHLFKVTSREFPKWFVLGWLNRHMSDFQMIAADKATTMGHIRRHHLRDALCVIPSGAFMETANRVCGAIHKRYVAAKLQSKSLSDLREALLSKLLSGEVRIKDAEIAVEAVA